MSDPQSFKDIINALIDSGVTPRALCDEFGISAGTVERWAAGRSWPVPMAQPIIVQRINEFYGTDFILARS